MPIPPFLNYCSFIVNLEITSVSPLNLLFFQDHYGCSRTFALPLKGLKTKRQPSEWENIFADETTKN